MRYKVLWIDDDCNTTGRDFIGQAEQDDVDITPFESHEEGISFLEKNLNNFHAVILDAKVKHKKDDTVIGLEGLRASRDRLIELNNKTDLPYFIFTGQPDYQTNEMFKDSFGDFYVKGIDNERLVQDIINRIDKNEEYILKKEYNQAFDVFSNEYIGNKGYVHLLSILKKENKIKAFDNPDLYFNPLRKIMDDLFIAFNKYGLLPNEFIKPSVALNESSKFLSGSKEKGYKLEFPVFPKVVSDNVKNILAVCQPASHRAEIDSFVSMLKTPYLLLSVTYQLLDVLIWFKIYIDENNDVDLNILKYKYLDEDNDSKIEFATIDKDEYGNYHCGEIILTYLIINENNYKVGDKIKINKFVKNTNEKTIHLFPYKALLTEKIKDGI
jgi:hypothetical protein